jgi:hypothetical protein
MKTPLILLLFVASFAHADLVVSGGYLVVKDGTLNASGTVSVADGAVLRIHEPSSLDSSLLYVLAGGLVEGCGTIHAEVLNEGEILANCGPGTAIIFGAAMTNEGTVRASDGSGILANASFVNNGVLDLIFGAPEIPVNLLGSGTLLTADRLPALEITRGQDGVVTLFYQAYRPHRYRIEWSETLAPDSWELLWSDDEPATETHTRLIEDNTAVGQPKRFYRYAILE